MNGRYDYIDIAKGIGILMVVWAHIMLTGWTHQLIYAFHMPLFFLLSGMLFKKEKYSSYVSFMIHRANRLFIPYIIYSVLTWILWATFRYVRHDEVDSYMMPLLQTVIAQGSGAYIVHNSALWFIPCLFLVEILYFFISQLSKWLSVLICFGCAASSFALGAFYSDDYWFMLPWNADAALIALPFYCIGNLVAREIGLGKVASYFVGNKGVSIFVWMILGAILYWSAMSFGECSMGSSSYHCPSWIFIVRAFIGCAWLIGLALVINMIRPHDRITTSLIKYLKWAGLKSLDIMCIHIPAKGICMIIVGILLHTTVDDISYNEWYSMLAMVLTMIATWLTIRVLPVNSWIQKLHIG